MAEIPLAFVEGYMEEHAARKLLGELGFEKDSTLVVIAGDCVRFWKRAPEFNKAARHLGYVLGLTDLDAHVCPGDLIEKKLPAGRDPRFLLRIQVRELESWLLADFRAWAGYLHLSPTVFPREPDLLMDPKLALVNLARRCRKQSIREDIVPQNGTPRIVGPGYSTRLAEFITDFWNPRRAAERSPSLARAIARLEQVRS